MFRGNYNFFEYKYNIVGYTGQDYGGFAQKLYLIISVILMVILLVSLRKSSKEKVLKIIRGISIFLILFYIGKTTWESVYDIKLSGSFNTGLLPFDTCSIPMLAGFATMLFLNAFKYYPFLSFGAFYSMIWHFLMVFLGLLLIVTNYVDTDFKTVLNGYIFHVIISLIVIPIDFIFNFDFMLYKDLGGVPIFEGIASKLTSMNLQLLNPILMFILYFIAFNIVVMIPMFIKKIKVQLCK